MYFYIKAHIDETTEWIKQMGSPPIRVSHFNGEEDVVSWVLNTLLPVLSAICLFCSASSAELLTHISFPSADTGLFLKLFLQLSNWLERFCTVSHSKTYLYLSSSMCAQQSKQYTFTHANIHTCAHAHTHKHELNKENQIPWRDMLHSGLSLNWYWEIDKACNREVLFRDGMDDPLTWKFHWKIWILSFECKIINWEFQLCLWCQFWENCTILCFQAVTFTMKPGADAPK